MKKRNILLSSMVFGVISVALWRANRLPVALNTSQHSAIERQQVIGEAGTKADPGSGPAVEPQMSLHTRSKEDAMKAWFQRHQLDKDADWKTPILFYGMVVDEKLVPIAGANIHFQWTDLSNKGSADSNTVSDPKGLFSLNGVHGKRLIVKVSKEGYYTAGDLNQMSFEYSNPGEETYYEPDRQNPVLFHLRKKGKGVQLIQKSVEVVLPGDGSAAKIDMENGAISQSGELEVRAWKPWPPRPMSPHYDWKVTFNLSNGGFVPSNDEFSFEAPQMGYSPSVEIDMPANAGNAWAVSAEKSLYFVYGEPKKYGHLNIRTDGNSRYIFIEYGFNPSGSRDLENATAEHGNPGK